MKLSVSFVLALAYMHACIANNGNNDIDRVVHLHQRGERLVYYLHLHKCGGTSMCQEAQEHGERLPHPHANCNARGDGVVRRRGPGGLYNAGLTCQQRLQDLRRYDVTYFQTENIFHLQNLECLHDLQLVVSLRKPISRAISHIRYERMFIRTGVQHFRDATFENDIREDPRHGSATINNLYIRTLLGVEVYQLPLGGITREHLEQAKQVLKQFVVLILEQSEQNRQLMKCYADWKYPEDDGEESNKDGQSEKQGKVINKTGGSADKFLTQYMDAEWRAKLEELNQLDTELYEYAKSLSQHQLDDCITHYDGLSAN